MEIDERRDDLGGNPSQQRRRATDKGFVSASLSCYLQLLDWTGRQIRSGRRGRIPNDLAPILQRLGLEPSNWCELVNQFGRLFKRVVGRPDRMKEEARRRGKQWLQASALLN